MSILEIARKACAQLATERGSAVMAEHYRAGTYDDQPFVLYAKRAAELATERAAGIADEEAATYCRIYAERYARGDDGNPLAHERSQDRVAARARTAQAIGRAIRGEPAQPLTLEAPIPAVDRALISHPDIQVVGKEPPCTPGIDCPGDVPATIRDDCIGSHAQAAAVAAGHAESIADDEFDETLRNVL